MYECTKCNMRWMGGFCGDLNNDEHICKICGNDCSRK